VSEPKRDFSLEWLQHTVKASDLMSQMPQLSETDAAHVKKQYDKEIEQADEAWNWMHVDPVRLRRAIETGEV
jgi:hypothetical protein